MKGQQRFCTQGLSFNKLLNVSEMVLMVCRSFASLQAFCDCGMKVAGGEEGRAVNGPSGPLTRIKQQNHCGLSLKELCHRTSVNSCALMTNDSSLVCRFIFTSSVLLPNQLKLSKMNHHETEADVQESDALLF